ncbi:MAG: PIN domain-containing protein [Verrucomicrobia bacterium]|jgi:PIN domain nuclease of toxin-antitoxin system|nr:PIN domain-containing protein [Verrucomicrobiota bacterium]
MALILDTCGLLSLAGIADKALSQDCLEAIRSAETLYISSCSAFEIALKQKRGQLNLGEFRTREAFWEVCIEKYVLTEVPVSAKIFTDAVHLPDHHADPFDRLIIATALAQDCRIVTYDKLFNDYPVKTTH